MKAYIFQNSKILTNISPNLYPVAGFSGCSNWKTSEETYFILREQRN